MKKVILDKLDEQHVKDLLQEKTPDGVVNTIPELMERFGEIPDGMSMDEYIRQVAVQSAIDPETLKEAVYEAIEKNVATDEDIRALFD